MCYWTCERFSFNLMTFFASLEYESVGKWGFDCRFLWLFQNCAWKKGVIKVRSVVIPVFGIPESCPMPEIIHLDPSPLCRLLSYRLLYTELVIQNCRIILSFKIAVYISKYWTLRKMQVITYVSACRHAHSYLLK